MLELKLAMYIDYPQRMPAGIFVTSADTIELYVLDGDWTFMNKGFTAMAHPSPIEIGTTHGVFVLEDSSMKTLTEVQDNDSLISARNGRCKKFLHKPTKELMRSSGAAFTHNGEEYIYSDSAYFMDYDTSKILLDWYRQHGPLDCEIDAYGDFLQALGPEGTIDYCKNVRNVTLVTENLVKTREEIFNLLRNCPLNVLMLNKSKFYHIGTTLEYLHHFCEDTVYRYEMACSNVAMVLNNSSDEKFEKDRCLIHCFLEGNNKVGEKSVVEYSWLSTGAQIGHTSIVSQVFIPECLVIPDRVFMHTVCVQDKSLESKYVTVVFGIDDNLKKSCKETKDIDMLSIYGQSLGHALDLLQFPKDPWPENCSLLNLWNARLFPSFDTPHNSSKFAVSMIETLGDDQPQVSTEDKENNKRLYSMADILKEKDLKGIFKMREEIRNKILS